LNTDSQALVCRVNFFGWSISGRRSLAEWFFNKFTQGEPIKGFIDAIFSPLLATDLAGILLTLIERNSRGLFHVVNPQSISKYDFGVALAKRFGFNTSLITPTTMQNAGLVAVRSPNLNLDTKKLSMELGEQLPDQATELLRFHQQYLDRYPQQLKSYSMSII
jgi:dTDP-4-dehydrorhamnose reductase